MEKYINVWDDIKPVYVSDSLWLKSDFNYPFEVYQGEYQPKSWDPSIPSKIISSLSKEGETVLDPFVGAGTTLFSALMLNRKAIGCDINSTATHLSRELINLTLEGEGIYIRKKDARRLYGIDDSSIDLICTQLPYYEGKNCDNEIKGDMSNMEQEEYLLSMEKSAKESYRVLKKGRYCAVMAGDTKKDNCVMPIGIYTANAFKKAGFKLIHVIINKRQKLMRENKKDKYPLVPREYIMQFIK